MFFNKIIIEELKKENHVRIHKFPWPITMLVRRRTHYYIKVFSNVPNLHFPHSLSQYTKANHIFLLNYINGLCVSIYDTKEEKHKTDAKKRSLLRIAMSTKQGEDENQSDQSFFDLDDNDDDDGLEVSLKADGQNSLTLHIPQLGLRGVQTVCPNPT